MVLFFSALRDTVKDIFTDTGVLLVLLIAPVVYAFYYPMPYSNEIVRRLPVAVVDHAQDSLSRKIIRMASAAPAIDVHVVSDERQAWQQLLNNKVMAFMVIPANLKRNISVSYSNFGGNHFFDRQSNLYVLKSTHGYC